MQYTKIIRKINGGGNVRYAEENDVKRIKELADSYIDDIYLNELKFNKSAIHEIHTIDEVKEIALSKINPTFIYEESDEHKNILGFISLYKKSDNLCAIKLFSVDKKSQNSGIGTKLMERALSEFKCDYYLKINYYNPIKDKLIKYYNKFGFIVESEDKEYIKMIKKFI